MDRDAVVLLLKTENGISGPHLVSSSLLPHEEDITGGVSDPNKTRMKMMKFLFSILFYLGSLSTLFSGLWAREKRMVDEIPIGGEFFLTFGRPRADSSRARSEKRGDNKWSHQTLILESHACWWLHLVSPLLLRARARDTEREQMRQTPGC